MPTSRRLRTASVCVAVVGLLLTACTFEEPAEDEPEAVPEQAPDEPGPGPGPHAGGTLRVGLVIDPVSIDPRFVVDDEGELIVDALFDPLVRIDDDGHPLPAAAASFEVDDGGTRFTFHLREAEFHDGTPVIADDFVRTFDRITDGTADPPSFLAYLLDDVVGADAAQADGEPLAGVTAVDERTLEIELDDPQPGFLATLADPSLVPTPPEADADPEAYGREPIGNGAFAMAGPREPGSFVRLTAADDHHQQPYLDEVLFTIYPDDGTGEQQWEDLREGQLHVGRFPIERREDVLEAFGRSSDGYQGPGLVDGVTSSAYLYGFNVTEPPFDDPRLRRALSFAMDRVALADDLLDGTRVPATSIVPPPFPGSQPDACDHCRHDPGRARELLDEVVDDLVAADEDDPAQDDPAQDDPDQDDPAEAPDDDAAEAVDPAEVVGPIQLTHNRGATHTAVAEQLAGDIENALGLDVDFQARDLQVFVRAVRDGRVPVFRVGWDVAVPDAGGYLWPLFHSSQVGLDNLTRYDAPDVDALLEQGRSAQSAIVRVGAYRQAERLILEDAPALPVLWDRHRLAIAPGVQELTISPFGRMSLREAWLDPQGR